MSFQTYNERVQKCCAELQTLKNDMKFVNEADFRQCVRHTYPELFGDPFVDNFIFVLVNDRHKPTPRISKVLYEEQTGDVLWNEFLYDADLVRNSEVFTWMTIDWQVVAIFRNFDKNEVRVIIRKYE